MSHRVKSVFITVLLLGLAVVLAACGSSQSDDSGRALPTIVQREATAEPTQVAVVPTERVLPTIAAIPTQQPNIDAPSITPDDNVQPLTPNLEGAVEEFVPPFQAPSLPDTGDTTQPNTDNTTSDPFSPPQTDTTVTAEDDVAADLPFMVPGSPSTASETDETGEDSAANNPSGGTDPFGGAIAGGPPTGGDIANDTPFGGAPGGSGGSTTNLPFAMNQDNTAGSPFDGGGDSAPFGAASDPFRGSPFATVGGSRWFINGEQPVSVLSCPETTCEVLGSLNAGDSVQLAGEAEAAEPGEEAREVTIDPDVDWVAITYNDGVAYIFRTFVSEREEADLDTSGFPGGGGGDSLPFDPSNFTNGGPPGGDPFGGGPPGTNGGGPPGFDGGSPFGNTGGSTAQNGVINSGGTFSTTTGFGEVGGSNPLYTAPQNPVTGGPPGSSCPPFLPNC